MAGYAHLSQWHVNAYRVKNSGFRKLDVLESQAQRLQDLVTFWGWSLASHAVTNEVPFQQYPETRGPVISDQALIPLFAGAGFYSGGQKFPLLPLVWLLSPFQKRLYLWLWSQLRLSSRGDPSLLEISRNYRRRLQQMLSLLLHVPILGLEGVSLRAANKASFKVKSLCFSSFCI